MIFELPNGLSAEDAKKALINTIQERDQLRARVEELEAERRYLLDAIQHWYMYEFDRDRALEILDKSPALSQGEADD